jgi:hypothetical protein
MNCLTPHTRGFLTPNPHGNASNIPKTVQAQQHLIEWRNAHKDSPDAWLCGIICEMFKRMVASRMQDAPAADVIASVAANWIDIVGEGMTEELDRERIIAGFKLLFRECRRWPQPADLLKRLPRRQSPPLQKGDIGGFAVDEGQHERSSEAIDSILENLEREPAHH